MLPIVFHPGHARHDPQRYFKAGEFHPHPEMPSRAESILAALRAEGGEIVAPDDFGPGPRADVHTAEYLDFLSGVHRRWTAEGQAGDEVVPNIHPGRHMAARPASLLGQVGFHTTDLSSPVGPGTWAAACGSANTALHAAKLVLDGAPAAYALCRPPGHHAYADMAGGFCFLNNIAIAAQYAVRRGKRPAILDVDVHAGNGTQGIFYRRPDVLTVSLHCDPADYYPFFAGHADERGAGDGTGCHLNLPVPPETRDNAYLAALDTALNRITAWGADILFVALGVDGYEKDPLRGICLTTPGFNRIARAIGELTLPTVLIQEGGYNVPDLGRNVLSFLEGFETAHG
ncbi:MAG: histone deacetylase family protein [Rhodospirillaceae bacterium]|nr:histone deacetylase family protein [Rhodospirillaceae bacterium]MYB14302.1 histone deacetylase family protein [Rhodospirillaceae bacterium]MYI48330.1 histone deacetylase family protein [Rhodospirillaceae bacterium]